MNQPNRFAQAAGYTPQLNFDVCSGWLSCQMQKHFNLAALAEELASNAIVIDSTTRRLP